MKMLYQGRYPKYLHHKHAPGRIFFLDRRGYYCYWALKKLNSPYVLCDWMGKDQCMDVYLNVEGETVAEPFRPEHLLRIDCCVTPQMPFIKAYLEDLLEEISQGKFDI